MHITIFGSGIIGIFTAYTAIKQGFKITLIEKNHEPLTGATAQNGGQLSFSHILSICNINILRSLIEGSLKQQHPVNLNIFNVAANLPWCASFIKNSYEKKNYAPLLHLSKISHEIFSQLDKKNHLESLGTIHLFRNEKSYKKIINNKELLSIANINYQELDKTDLKNLCPNLENISQFNKALFFPGDMCGDAKKFSLNLFSELKKNKNFKFIAGQELKNIEIDKGRISKVITTDGEYSSDKYILSPGAYISDFSKYLKLKLPIAPLKGYSFNHKNLELKTAVIDEDNKIVYSPFDGYTRIAGLYDFKGFSNKIQSRRVKYFRQQVNKIFATKESDMSDLWCGFRPITSDRFPIIGKSSIYENLYYNVGHANLGWTLSAGSAQILIDEISNKPSQEIFNCFRPARFKI